MITFWILLIVTTGIVAWLISWSDVENLNNYFKDPKISKRVSRLLQAIGTVIWLVVMFTYISWNYVP